MRVLLFGATGMVGQGVLRECLRDERVTAVLTVGRSVTGQQSPKLREVARAHLFDLAGVNERGLEEDLTGFDVCFFVLGVASVGMSEKQYTHITYDLTLSVATTVLRLNPGLIFLYVSGMGTDSSEQGRSMWARVKGRTENALLRMPFGAAYMLRPALIVPLDGIRSKTRLYSTLYAVLKPLLPWLQRTFPQYVTTTAELGRAMLALAVDGGPSRVIENREITRRDRQPG